LLNTAILQDLKAKCQSLGVSDLSGKKADLIQRILEAEAAAGTAGDHDEEHLEEEEELEDPAPVTGDAVQQQAPASKHAKIVFGAEAPKKVVELQKPSVSGPRILHFQLPQGNTRAC
jgi:hypothetical protein